MQTPKGSHSWFDSAQPTLPAPRACIIPTCLLATENWMGLLPSYSLSQLKSSCIIEGRNFILHALFKTVCCWTISILCYLFGMTWSHLEGV